MKPHAATRSRDSGRPARWAAFLLLATLCSLAYANTLFHGFVWDDRLLVVENPAIRSPAAVFRCFVSGPFSRAGGDFYRPLQILSYAADCSLWGLNPFGYHLTNVLLHLANSLLLFSLFAAVTGNRRTALAAAALFAAHPINTEAVAYVAGRADLLAAFFMFGALLCICGGRPDHTACAPPSRAWCAAGLFALALLSKEGAIVLPVLALLCLASAGRRGGRDSLAVAILFAVAALYLGARVSLRAAGFGHPPSNPYPFAWRFFTSFKVALAYLGLLALPCRLTMERIVHIETSPLSPTVLLPLAVILLAAALSASAWRRSRPASFGAAWFFAALLPYLNWFPLNAEMAEHWLYVPAAGVFLLAAIVSAPAWERRRAPAVACLLVLACLVCLTVRRNADWRDEERIYTRTARLSPGSPRARYNFGNIYLAKGMFREAADEYRASLILKPGDSACRRNLGNALLGLGRTGDAIEELEKAAAIDPSSADTHARLGAAYGMAGKNEEAVRALHAALRLDPASARAHNNLASVYTNQGRFAEAREEYMQALALDPGLIEARFNLGIVLFNLGDREGAAAQFDRVLAEKPGFAPAAAWRARVNGSPRGRTAPVPPPPSR